jgi:hypothetical protein
MGDQLFIKISNTRAGECIHTKERRMMIFKENYLN